MSAQGERYGTNIRTIRRDLDGLQSVGLTIAEEGNDGKRKRLGLAFKNTLMRLAEVSTEYAADRARRR